MTHPSLESWGNAEGKENGGDSWADVVLLTGVDRLVQDAVAFSLSDSCPSAWCLTYDVASRNTGDGIMTDGIGLDDALDGLDGDASNVIIVRSERRSARVGDVLGLDREDVPMDDCCMTCTVKHDLAATMRRSGAAAELVLVCLPVGVEGAPVAQYLADCSMLGELPWGLSSVTVATAVGIDDFEARLFDDGQLVIAGRGDDAVCESRSTGVVQARLIREAEHVLELPLRADGSLAADEASESAREALAADRLIRALSDPEASVHANAHEVDLHALVTMFEPMHGNFDSGVPVR